MALVKDHDVIQTLALGIGVREAARGRGVNLAMEYRITAGRLEIGKFSLYYERAGAGAV
jgi:hypothetical protein